MLARVLREGLSLLAFSILPHTIQVRAMRFVQRIFRRSVLWEFSVCIIGFGEQFGVNALMITRRDKRLGQSGGCRVETTHKCWQLNRTELRIKPLTMRGISCHRKTVGQTTTCDVTNATYLRGIAPGLADYLRGIAPGLAGKGRSSLSLPHLFVGVVRPHWASEHQRPNTNNRCQIKRDTQDCDRG